MSVCLFFIFFGGSAPLTAVPSAPLSVPGVYGSAASRTTPLLVGPRDAGRGYKMWSSVAGCGPRVPRQPSRLAAPVTPLCSWMSMSLPRRSAGICSMDDIDLYSALLKAAGSRRWSLAAGMEEISRRVAAASDADV